MTLSLTSEGDDASRSATFELEVMAVEVSETPQETTPTDEEGNSDTLSQESNALPWIGGIELLMLIGLASLRKHFN